MSKNIVLFSGGRGNKNLLNSLIHDIEKKNLNLSVIVNGLDDGASTGKIRYLFSKPTHGISDFLKVILSLSSNNEIVDLFEKRFPSTNSKKEQEKLMDKIQSFLNGERLFILEEHDQIDRDIENSIRSCLSNLCNHFDGRDNKEIDFSDFKIGNIIFASQIIDKNFNFKSAILEFSRIVSVDFSNVRIIQSSEAPAYLCGVLKQGIFLPNEASIVLSRTTDFIEDIFQIPESLTAEQIREICSLEKAEKIKHLDSIQYLEDFSDDAKDSISTADCIVYGAGTPFSSLLPSLSLKGAAKAISNKECPKIMVANLKKETQNFFSANQLIRDLLKHTLKNFKENEINPEKIITHLVVSSHDISHEDKDYSIDYSGAELNKEFPWVKIIESDLAHPEKKFQHDGNKLKKCILKILSSE
tara:strand:- start:16929 stop:18170 length:1242 start_codon:yes stop_codon:yes gene_type:complete